MAHPARVGELGCRATCVDFEGEIVVKTGDKANEGVRNSKLAQDFPQSRVLNRNKCNAWVVVLYSSAKQLKKNLAGVKNQ